MEADADMPVTTVKPVDYWDSSSTDQNTMWFRYLPEQTLDDLFGDERDMIRILSDTDGFWMAQDGDIGQVRFDTIEEAKAAGDEAWNEAESASAASLMKDSGLDAAFWTMVHQDGLRFVRTADGATIEADEDAERQSWNAFAPGSDDPTAEGVGTVAEALASLPTN